MIPIAMPTSDLETILYVIIRALQVAKTRRTMLSEVSEPSQEFEPTPELYVARRTGFVSQPSDDIGYVVVATEEGRELHVRFGWPQLRSLVSLIQEFDIRHRFPERRACRPDQELIIGQQSFYQEGLDFRADADPPTMALRILSELKETLFWSEGSTSKVSGF